MSIDVYLQMETITCCRQGCGLTFAVPTRWREKRREDHTEFYCPNGHPQHFTGETEAERLRREVAIQKRRAELMEAAAAKAHREAVKVKATLKKERGRVGNGVCPCCNRTFANLQRHMRGQHPEHATAG